MVAISAAELSRQIKDAAREISDTDALLQRIGADILPKTIGDVLRSAGSAGGVSWPPNSATWAKAKQKDKLGRDVGIRTGAMRDEISSGAFDRRVEKNALIASPRLKYVYYFHHGVRTRNIPARPIWMITDDAEREITALIDEHIREALE